MLNKIYLLGVGITSESRDTILEEVWNLLKKDQKFFIVTPNPEFLVYAKNHYYYRKILNSAKISLADGVGLFWAGKLLGKKLKERITGVDFIENICEMSREKPISMGFMGSRSNIAENTVERLRHKYPWINVVYASDEWRDDGWRDKKRPIIDMLFVAYGFPKQEKWICENLNSLPVRAAMGVGGAFDYLSGEIRRAPKPIRSIGLEWLYRLVHQPWRWKRQLALLEFVWLVVSERLNINKK